MFGNWWRRRSALVGVDVGCSTIHLVETVAQPGRPFRVRTVAEEPAPPGSVADDMVTDAAAVGAAIRRALKQAPIRARRAVLAVSPQFGYIRKVTFPPMPLAELRAAIDLQPERYIPLAQDESVYDLHPLGDTGDGQQAVVIAAAPRQQVSALMAACRAGGLQPVRVDMQPLALHRAAVGAGLITADTSAAFVDLNGHTTKISLFEGDVPIITRVVESKPPEDTGDSPFMIGQVLQNLCLDIRRSLEFALNQTSARPARLFVGGERGVDDFVLTALRHYLQSFLVNRLPDDFQVLPVQAPELGLTPAQMMAFGLSLSPEWFP